MFPPARSRPLFLCLLLLAGVAGCLDRPPAVAAATPLDWEATREQDHEAAFRLWLPEGLTHARAVIVLVPGLNGDGRAFTEDADWRRLAERTGTALLGCSMRGQSGGFYYEADRWSGAVLLHALAELGSQTGHAEIVSAPLLFWGHSAGGQFNHNFARWRPERVQAFVANKGAYYEGQPGENTRRVPALWIAGEKDTEERLQNITGRFAEGRRQGAPWCLAIEPGTAHEVGRTKELGIRFLAAILRVQAAGDGHSMGEAWTGDLSDHAIYRTADRPPNPRRLTSWLPDETAATAWRAFVTGEPMPGPGE